MARALYITLVALLLSATVPAIAAEQWRELLVRAQAEAADDNTAAAAATLADALASAKDQGDVAGIVAVSRRLANIVADQGAHARADQLLSSAIAASQSQAGDSMANADMLADRAAVRAELGNHQAAIGDYTGAIEIRERLLGPQHISVAGTLDELADLHLALKDYADAKTLFERAAQIRMRTLGGQHPQIAIGHDNLARLHVARGDTAAASREYQRALEIRRAAWGDRHPSIATNLHDLAQVALLQQDRPTAITLIEEALAIRVDLFGADNPDVTRTREALAALRNELQTPAAPSLGAAAQAGGDSPVPAAPADVAAAPPKVTARPLPKNDPPAAAQVTAEASEPPAPAATPTPPAPQVAAAPAAAPATRSPPPPAPPAYMVQLASLRDDDVARQEWRRLKSAFPGILGGRDLVLVRADLDDRGTFYRIRTGPFPSSAAANATCAGLEEADQACLVIAP